jgi:hypothetical protein
MASDQEKVKCPYCDKSFLPGGIGSHKASCKKKFDATTRESQFVASLLAEPQRAFTVLVVGVHVITIGSGSLPIPQFVAPWQRGGHAGQSSIDEQDPPGHDC